MNEFRSFRPAVVLNQPGAHWGLRLPILWRLAHALKMRGEPA